MRQGLHVVGRARRAGRGCRPSGTRGSGRTARTPGSRPSARGARGRRPRSSGRAEVRGAEGDHVGDQVGPRRARRRCATAQAARMTSPPIEWPTSAIRRTSAGQAATRSLEQRGQRDAVLARSAARCWRAGRPASSPCRRPAARRSVAAGLARAGGSSGSSFSHRPCRKTTTSAGRVGERRGEGLGVERRRRGRAPHGHRDRQLGLLARRSRSPIRPLTAETTNRPRRDVLEAGADAARGRRRAARGGRPAGRRRGRRRPPTRCRRGPARTPRTPPVAPVGDAVDPVGHGAVRVAHGADDAARRRCRWPARGRRAAGPVRPRGSAGGHASRVGEHTPVCQRPVPRR